MATISQYISPERIRLGIPLLNCPKELYKLKAGKIGRQLEEIRRKIEESERDAKMLEQDNTAKEMKLEEFLNMEKFDTEKLREIIKVIRVHSQEEIEIEWNFDDVFLGQR